MTGSTGPGNGRSQDRPRHRGSDGRRTDPGGEASCGAGALPGCAAECAQDPERAPRFAGDMVIGGLLMVLLHLFVLQISVVKGHSMEPSLWDGDRLVVDRLSYQLMDVSRNDVVVLRYPVEPGDRLRQADRRRARRSDLAHPRFLYVNGEPQSGEYELIRTGRTCRRGRFRGALLRARGKPTHQL